MVCYDLIPKIFIIDYDIIGLVGLDLKNMECK